MNGFCADSVPNCSESPYGRKLVDIGIRFCNQIMISI
jgi:hypothetical protein